MPLIDAKNVRSGDFWIVRVPGKCKLQDFRVVEVTQFTFLFADHSGIFSRYQWQDIELIEQVKGFPEFAS